MSQFHAAIQARGLCVAADEVIDDMTDNRSVPFMFLLSHRVISS